MALNFKEGDKIIFTSIDRSLNDVSLEKPYKILSIYDEESEISFIDDNGEMRFWDIDWFTYKLHYNCRCGSYKRIGEKHHSWCLEYQNV